MFGTKIRFDGGMLCANAVLLAACFAASSFVLPLAAQAPPAASSSKSSPKSSPNPASAATPTTYRPNPFPKRAHAYYSLFWGIDSLSVKAAGEGEMIRFTWRVLDANKAKPLNDEKIEPFLIDPSAHVKLVIPQLPFIGKVRQISPPEAGRLYWMAFSNPGRTVKPGDRVDVVVGQFHADNLVVQ